MLKPVKHSVLLEKSDFGFKSRCICLVKCPLLLVISINKWSLIQLNLLKDYQAITEQQVEFKAPVRKGPENQTSS